MPPFKASIEPIGAVLIVPVLLAWLVAPDYTPATAPKIPAFVPAADAAPFSARWHGEIAPRVVRVRTQSIVPDVQMTTREAEPIAPELPEPPPLPRPRDTAPVRIVQRAALRNDICARHGLRRVEYLVRGYKHWRCR